MAGDSGEMLSVGIDVGTTTTQIVFSKLILAGGGASGAPPPVRSALNPEGMNRIADSELVYRGEPCFTPLSAPDIIDAAALERILRREYERAGISPEQVETGAVIITGETAKKRNADEIIEALSHLAGDFVVTVAGPHLESMISGRGAGADAFSRQHYTTVTNVDIGGGSANSAVFRQGRMIAAAAMNYGGRILIMDPTDGRLQHISDPARMILAHLGISLNVGQAPDMAQLRAVTDCMADLTVELIEQTNSALGERLMLTDPSPVSGKGTILFFSGGVGHYVYEPTRIDTIGDVIVHGDVGPLLAESIRRHPGLAEYDIRRPPETLQATVMGASTRTVTLSGSTIWAETEILPVRNVPVIHPRWPAAPPTREQVAEAASQAVTLWDVAATGTRFALGLELTWQMDYASLTELAEGLARFADARLPAAQPLIIIIERDYARALGQTLKSLSPARPLLVIDQVGLAEGDYIDIGRPMMGGRVVPLSVKTLIFYR